MRPPKGVWGIDIGQCALKALRLEMVDGRPTATAFDYVEHPKILSQPDADPDMLIREALEKFLSRNQTRHDDVAIGIAGQSGLARFVKLPPVEEKKIAEIVKFEAKQQIPFPLDEVVWDFQKIAGGEVSDGFAMETEIGLFAMKRDVISRYLGYFAGSKIECHVVQMSPLALVNYTTYDILKKGGATPAEAEEAADEDDTPRGKKRCVVVLDIGTEASNLIITDGGKIIWQRPIPLGGNNFTRALTKELKLTFAKAEHLKRNAAKSPELPLILKALKPVLQDFVGEVQRSLGYFTNTHRDAHVGYMVGLGSAFRLPGLQKYLAEKLTLEVKKPTSFTRAVGDAVLKDPLFVENLLTFPVAYGLALQGLGEARLTTNLLPGEIRTDRLIRAKKPYAVAAAATLLLGTAGLALGYGASYKAIDDPSINKAIETAKGASSAFTTQESKFNAKKAEVAAYEAQVKAVIAGQDERFDWPRFDEVFAAALPHPGAEGNLPRELWANNNGAAAVAWFQKRMREGVKIEDSGRDEQSGYPLDLAMVNVEAVYPRWVDNLSAFFQAADNEVYGDPTATPKKGFGMDIAAFMKADEKEKDGDRTSGSQPRMKPKAPEGGGWVVEVRGYTDHKDGREFIKASLLANLQNANKFAMKDGGTEKVPKYVPGVTDPIKDRVSHAFIYHVWEPLTTGGPPTAAFREITRSRLDALAGGSGAAGGSGSGAPLGGMTAGPGGMTAGPGGTTTAAAPVAVAGQPWTPLTGTPSTGTGGAGGAFVAPATPALSGGSTPPPPPVSDGPPRRRYEFIVMFVWREPVPSATPPEKLNGPPAPTGTGMPR